MDPVGIHGQSLPRCGALRLVAAIPPGAAMQSPGDPVPPDRLREHLHSPRFRRPSAKKNRHNARQNSYHVGKHTRTLSRTETCSVLLSTCSTTPSQPPRAHVTHAVTQGRTPESESYWVSEPRSSGRSFFQATLVSKLSNNYVYDNPQTMQALVRAKSSVVPPACCTPRFAEGAWCLQVPTGVHFQIIVTLSQI